MAESMSERGKSLRSRPSLGTPLLEDTPPVREEIRSRTFKRISNVNLQRSIQLLDDAVGTPPSGQVRRSSGLLRHTAYAPQDLSGSSFIKSTMQSPLAARATPSLDDTSMMHSFTVDATLGTFAELPSMLQDVTTTNVGLLLEEDPGLAASTGLYTDFLEAMRSCPSEHQIFDLLKKYETACSDQVSLLKKLVKRIAPHQQTCQKTRDMHTLLDNERQTWQLIHILYKDRLETEIRIAEQEDDMIVESLDKHKSEKELVDTLFERDCIVRRSQLVVDWLEHNATEYMDGVTDHIKCFIDKAVSWENTLHKLQNRKLGYRGFERPIVDQMDPDAPLRQNGQLDDLDQEDETRLLQFLFTCIRSGQLDKAQETCIQCGQAWRAATLEGWRLFHDPNYESLGPGGQVQPILGNPYRDVWRSVCWNLSNDAKVNVYEKAIYAALSGNLPSILPVCQSWSDYLWAYFKILVDSHIEQEIRMNTSTTRSLIDLPDDGQRKLLSPEGLFQEIEACPNETIRNESRLWYSIIQKNIILGNVNGLLEQFNQWLSSHRDHIPTHLIRFMAHLMLYLRSISNDVEVNSCNAVLEVYVEELIRDQRRDLVAAYVATLPQASQIYWYAKFLEGIEETNERQQCLSLAEQAGLDVPRITKAVVENIRNRAVSDRATGTPQTGLEAEITDEDRQKIDAIDWLVFNPSQRTEAMRQANAVMRTFIALRKDCGAKEVMDKVPVESIAIIHQNWKLQTGSDDLPLDDDNSIREYMCIKAFLDSMDAFNDWFKHFHHGKPTEPEVANQASFTERVAYEHRVKQYEADLARWKHQLGELTQATSDRIYNVLLFPGGWLVDMHQSQEEMSDESRVHQMELLKQLCIPQLCFLLHSVLHSTELYNEAFLLSDFIAADDRQLYKMFRKDELQKLLSLLRDSSISLLDQNKDPLGYDIS